MSTTTTTTSTTAPTTKAATSKPAPKPGPAKAPPAKKNGVTSAAAIKADIETRPAGVRGNATKYRVQIRRIGQDEGWTFTQPTASVDRFTRTVGKLEQRIDVTHSYSDLITTAEFDTGKGIDKVESDGKMYQVQAWLTGVKDPERKRHIKLSPEQVAANESGRGVAKIDRETPKAPAKKAAARKAA